ncbi:carboxylesterase [Aspergillus heteromorphus CBS 117.55]|uniref:Carboxylic ester hydrolase n=1 Tax=Aspergillus heteromorphus CBS 117.55 TaxID=1448321 RepID=A0A317V970_9EURO|nr:carboxylesterase [Aspergillus heteromorphus CBS 117.55]PWY70924.1 carboxylesterase [Aspergillus heteromorphus CBS 117.55]
MALGLFLLNLAVAGSAAASAASPTVFIDTYTSTIQGNRSQYINSVYNFKAIPFASAPTGEWRWHHPQHVKAWTGIRDATVFAPDCPQPGLDNTSEDCLYLNIWTPDTATLNNVVNNSVTGIGVVPAETASKYPVYVWMHGGRFSSGAASDPLYDGAGLASKGVVVITINYRLGALGFLAHPELSANSTSGTSGNYGLIDQQASLHWINENIASFGGDPTRITIGGQSAGAASVLDYLNSVLADDLFTQVIAESGAIYPSNPLIGSLAESYRRLSEAETQGVAFLESLGLNSIAEARDASVELLLKGSDLNDNTYAGTVFQNSSIYSEPPLFRPVLDGYVLPATYHEMLLRGNHSIAPVLTGGNRDENGASPNPGLTPSSYLAQNKQIFGSVGLAEEFFALYPRGNSSASADAASNAFYQDQTRISSWLWANEYATGSARNTSGNGTYQTYTYYWTHSPPGQDEGAYHGSEINYAFNNLYATDKPWAAADYAIADKLSDYWANFIRSGNPNGDGLQEWPVNSAESPVVLEVGDSWKTVAVASQEKIAFLKKWFEKWTAY